MHKSILTFQPGAVNPLRPLLRAGFATSRPQCRALPPGPRGTVRRPLPPKPLSKRPSRQPRGSSKGPEPPHDAPQETQSSLNALSTALRDSDSNNLLAPVHIPDDPDGVLRPHHPATGILSHSSVVVSRQLELMNVMLGFEQANKYVIMDPQGNHVGYMAERELGVGNMMARQMFSTHRSFTTHVFDKQGEEVLRFHRPFAWISSRIGIYDPVEVATTSYSKSTAMTTSNPGSLTTEVNPGSAHVSPLALSDMRIIGEVQQQWAPLRRKYNLFLYRNAPSLENRPESQGSPPPGQPLSNSQAMDLTPYNNEGKFNQFAYVNEPFLSWDFSLMSQDSKLIGSVNRNFSGFGREIFTDTGVYALRMDAAGLAQEGKHLISRTGRQANTPDQSPSASMTLDQRAVMLATAVSVDFDYFSRHSGSGGGMMSFMPIWFPGGGGGAAAGEAGAEAGAMEGAVEGAEANPVGQEGAEMGQGQPPPGPGNDDGGFWGEDNDFWGGNSGGGNRGGNNGGDSGGDSGGDLGGGGGGDFDWF